MNWERRYDRRLAQQNDADAPVVGQIRVFGKQRLPVGLADDVADALWRHSGGDQLAAAGVGAIGAFPDLPASPRGACRWLKP